MGKLGQRVYGWKDEPEKIMVVNKSHFDYHMFGTWDLELDRWIGSEQDSTTH